MISGPSILLIERDRSLGDALARELGADGYRVRIALSSEHARSLAAQASPTLVLLGQLDGAGSATTLLKELRGYNRHPGGANRDTPVLVLGAADDGLEVLRAFEAGADDFIARPIFYLELRARLRALQRRTGISSLERQFEVGSLSIDLDARSVTVGGRTADLCRMEFELLARLARNPDYVLTREELLLAVWGHGPGATTRTLDTHASRLRCKLAAVSSERWIPSIRGVGYRLI